MAELFANNTISGSYKEALQTKHSTDPNWGASRRQWGAPDYVEQIKKRGYVNTILDWGAGKGQMRKLLKKEAPHIVYTPYDPGMPEYDVLPDGPFDMVISTDVMEHIEPDLIEETLRQMWNRTKYVLIQNIACSKAGSNFLYGPYEGQNVHLIIEDTDWWVETHKRAIQDPKMSIMSITKSLRRHNSVANSGYKERCQIIIERVG